MVFSRRRERRISGSVGRLGSNAGEAMGENSDVIVNIPSKGRSGDGLVTSADIWTRILVFPRLMSATPYSEPNERLILR